MTLRSVNQEIISTTHSPYQAGLFLLADEERQYTVGHLICPRWFYPDQVLKMTRIRCRQNPILDADLAERVQRIKYFDNLSLIKFVYKLKNCVSLYLLFLSLFVIHIIKSIVLYSSSLLLNMRTKRNNAKRFFYISCHFSDIFTGYIFIQL